MRRPWLRDTECCLWASPCRGGRVGLSELEAGFTPHTGLGFYSSLCLECSFPRKSHLWLLPTHMGLHLNASPSQSVLCPPQFAETSQGTRCAMSSLCFLPGFVTLGSILSPCLFPHLLSVFSPGCNSRGDYAWPVSVLLAQPSLAPTPQ